jgi:hypothetical protein
MSETARACSFGDDDQPLAGGRGLQVLRIVVVAVGLLARRSVAESGVQPLNPEE